LRGVCEEETATNSYPAACKARAVQRAVASEQPIAQTARDLAGKENTRHPGSGNSHRVACQEQPGNAAPLSAALQRLRQEHARVQAAGAIRKTAAASCAPQLPGRTPGGTRSPRHARGVAWVGSWRSCAGAMTHGSRALPALRQQPSRRGRTKARAVVRRQDGRAGAAAVGAVHCRRVGPQSPAWASTVRRPRRRRLPSRRPHTRCGLRRGYDVSSARRRLTGPCRGAGAGRTGRGRVVDGPPDAGGGSQPGILEGARSASPGRGPPHTYGPWSPVGGRQRPAAPAPARAPGQSEPHGHLWGQRRGSKRLSPVTDRTDLSRGL
jgi:hypothetical protein